MGFVWVRNMKAHLLEQPTLSVTLFERDPMLLGYAAAADLWHHPIWLG